MSDKPEVSDGMKIAGVIGGIVVGGFVGAIALAAATMIGEMIDYPGVIPSPYTGGMGGAAIGLVLGLCFPEKLARALGELIAAL